MRVKAGLTVFLALLIGMMIAVVFGFLEAARVSGLKSNAEMQAMQAADSLLSEYHAGLWQNYDVLYWEASGEGAAQAALRQQQFLDQSQSYVTGKRIRREYPFLELNASRIVVDACEYATDRGGASFRKQAVLAAKENLAQTAVEELENAIANKDDNVPSEETLEQMEEDAGDLDHQLETTAESETEDSEAGTNAPATDTSDTFSPQQQRELRKDNPIKWMIRIRREGILSVVMQDKSISEKEIDDQNLIGKRNLQEGNYVTEKQGGRGDDLWYLLYLQQHFSDASRDSMGGALDYEMEYLVAGKTKDEDNLKAVVKRLLLMREGVNYVYLLHDSKKNNEALLLATAIVSAFGQPELAEPVKHAILLAWAYAESISDVRILLDGGKILPIKTSEQWRTDLSNLSGEYRGEEGSTDHKDEKGLNYTQYLQLFLLAEKKEKLTYRTLDLIEQREGVQMDHMVSRMKCSYLFEAPPLFWRFVSLGDNSFTGFSYQTSRKISYLPGEQN